MFAALEVVAALEANEPREKYLSSVYLLFFLRTFLGRMSSGEDILFLRVPTWTLVQNRWSHSLFRHISACAQC